MQLPHDFESRKRKCIQDWWKTVLWYVRLRRASKKKLIHTDLLKAEVWANEVARKIHQDGNAEARIKAA